jgi:hypothetical protein
MIYKTLTNHNKRKRDELMFSHYNADLAAKLFL